MPFAPEFFPDIDGFEWDEGNSDKNWARHEVSHAEAEQVFLNRPLVVAADPAHSAQEARQFALGRTDAGRLLMVVFTLRRPFLRVISVRPMSRREGRCMAKLKQSRQLPRFESEASERTFWQTHDTTGLVDWNAATAAVFPNLKPSTETISLRLPAGLLAELRVLANKRDVPYQSLLKVFLAERVARERVGQHAAMPNRRLQPTKARSSKRPTPKARARLRG